MSRLKRVTRFSDVLDPHSQQEVELREDNPGSDTTGKAHYRMSEYRD